MVESTIAAILVGLAVSGLANVVKSILSKRKDAKITIKLENGKKLSFDKGETSAEELHKIIENTKTAA